MERPRHQPRRRHLQIAVLPVPPEATPPTVLLLATRAPSGLSRVLLLRLAVRHVRTALLLSARRQHQYRNAFVLMLL